ncbi:molybdopterin-synthase adenylyltransferase MoeB [Bizionia gelidisalsuginis]|uniref:Molybdopterin-synthase adenylyltransferase MoeB n=1 Tax=Bizionia gelidisalsuginis TaxID=291188 RepID=A0ABY3MAC2_9FLAO|nr:molybdopterin-synthase adenylyltransferase MoeB [Bizionia gelidisalsuginis]TYC12677.1 molybdopterin-synthase adenylyltransferase MoeB [Bizionia gelidisalsuginis]
MTLQHGEEQQYNRHLILDEIGLSGQEKIKQSSVLVIGAGGLGCPILQYLTASGVGKIGIIDDDTISQSNLQRQVLYTHNDIGKHKAKVAANRLSGLNPYVNFEVYTERLSTKNALTLFSLYDIIVDGSDNFPTRYLVNDAAVLTNKPVVFGSIFKFEGQVSVFNYQNGPTYRCLFPTPPEPNTVPNCSEIGVLGILPGIIGSLQANEVIKIICGIGTVLTEKLLTFNTLTMQQVIVNYKKDNSVTINHLQDNYNLFCGITAKPLTEITLKELNTLEDPFILLDVRTPLEREHFNIGGLHIPLQELDRRFKELQTEKDIIVYCKAGMRSEMAIHVLREKGLKNTLINLKGGLFY